MRSRLLMLIFSLLLPLSAWGQKFDRGIDMSNQPVFVQKGTWMVGGGASWALHSNDKARLLVIEGINSTGYTMSISPAACYMVKDNMGVGMRAGYKRDMFLLDSAKVNIGDAALEFANYHAISQSFEIQGLTRFYIPVGNSKRIALFNEIQLGYTFGQGKVMDGHSSDVVGSYEVSNSVALNVCPGFMAFISDHLALDVNVNMLGIHFDWTDQIHNQVAHGSRNVSFINFKINLLAIGFSLYYYI